MAQLRRGNRASVAVNSSRVWDGIRYFNPKIALDHVTPDWDKTQYPSVFKVVPAINEAGGKKSFMPYRYDDGPDGFNDWFAPLPCATRIGTNKDAQQSFILYEPLDPTYDRSTNPYIILYSQIQRLAKSGNTNYVVGGKRVDTRAWKPLFGDVTDREGIAFSKPDRKITFMAVVPILSRDKIQVNDKTNKLRGVSEGDNPSILALTPQASGGLLQMLGEPGSNPGSQNYEEAYRYGDITRLDAGKLLIPFNNGKFSAGQFTPENYAKHRNTSELDDASSAFGGQGQGQGQGQQRSFSSYTIDLLDKAALPHPTVRGKVSNYSAGMLAKYEKEILQNYRPIADYFFLPSHDEIMGYLALAFRDQPEIIFAGLGDERHLFTDEVKAILRARTQVAVTEEPLADLSKDVPFISKPNAASEEVDDVLAAAFSNDFEASDEVGETNEVELSFSDDAFPENELTDAPDVTEEEVESTTPAAPTASTKSVAEVGAANLKALQQELNKKSKKSSKLAVVQDEPSDDLPFDMN